MLNARYGSMAMVAVMLLATVGCQRDDRLVKLAQEATESTRQMVQMQAETGRQRDLLEAERREIAGQRFRDPIIANVGLVLACLLPLVLGIYVLRGYGNASQPDVAVTEILVQELTSDSPLLLPSPNRIAALEYQTEPESQREPSKPV